MKTHLLESESALSEVGVRHLNPEEFLKEYAKGSQFEIELDPRIDLTEPIYEQALRLAALDEVAGDDVAPEETTKAA